MSKSKPKPLKKYCLTCSIKEVHGHQRFTVEAASEEDAKAKWGDGTGSTQYLDEECEVTRLNPPEDVYECDDEGNSI